MCQCNASCFAQSKQLRPQYTRSIYDLMTVLSLSGTVAAQYREPVLCLTAGAKCSRSYLVDSASSHMLVSKIKPCMSKYMPY